MHILLAEPEKAITCLTVVPVFSNEKQPFEMNEKLTNYEEVTIFLSRNKKDGDIVVVGLGERERITPERLRRAAGCAARKIFGNNYNTIMLENPCFQKREALEAFTEGFVLATYNFDIFKKIKNDTYATTLFISPSNFQDFTFEQLKETIENVITRRDGVFFTRNLCNMPASHMYPKKLAEAITDRFKDSDVKVTVYEGEDLDKMGFCGLTSVGRGSRNPAAFIEISYCSNPSKPLTALIGKGVTYDMGGMNIKTGPNLSESRFDMGGAAAIAGAFDIIARKKMDANLIGLIPTTENLPDSQAILPSTVIQYPNNISVEVGNTDAEGRLILADAMLYASRCGAKKMIDIATLTGSIGFALGHRIAGIWGDEAMTDALFKQSYLSGDFVWKMPLVEDYEEEIKSDFADISNTSATSLGGAIKAALFLRNFVGDGVKWVHMDIASTSFTKKAYGYYPIGATGYGTRLLADFIALDCS